MALGRVCNILFIAVAAGFRVPAQTGAVGRRAALSSGFALAGLMSPLAASAAVKSCPSGANNCYSSTSGGKNKMAAWSWPSSEDRESALSTLAGVIESYPQAGQDGADMGGWTVAEGSLASGNARVEFKSGLGNFAKFFNGNKPFVDDLVIAAGDSNVAIFSSSRVGDSDFGVNAKRLNYLSAKLRAKGWDAPAVKPFS